MMAPIARKIGVAVIGTRFGNLHAEAISEQSARAHVVAVCSRTATHAMASAKRWGAQLGTTSFEQVLQHPEVDAVHLCVPHDLHAPMAVAAAEAGKHIMTEKPIATTVDEADRMIAAADKAGVMLMVSLNQRFLGHHQRAKELVESGVIGDLFLCQSQFLGFSPIKGWRHDAAQTGGGVLVDSGMHKIDLLRWIAGEVTSVQALSGCYTHTAMEGEDTAVLMLRFASGAIGQVVSSWGIKRPIREESLMLAGTGGTIWTENATLSLTSAIEESPGEIRQREKETFPEVSYPDSVKQAVGHFLDCIQGKTDPLTTAQDGREALRIAQAAYAAVKTGRRVDL